MEDPRDETAADEPQQGEDRPGPDLAPDVPEADAIEQSQPVEDEEPRPSERLRHVPDDVPEADAIEQSLEVPDDDDRR